MVVVGLLNLHVALYQCYAWAMMLNDRIPEQGIEHALSTTFSGEHPCEKCLAVVEQRAKEEQKPQQTVDVGQKAPLVYSLFSKQELNPLFGARVPFASPECLPLFGIEVPVIGPPPKFV